MKRTHHGKVESVTRSVHSLEGANLPSTLIHYDCAVSMKQASGKCGIEFIYPDLHPVRNEVAWYKWEFLRRNPRYRADFQKFVGVYGAWFKKRGYWFDYKRRLANWTQADEDHFYAKIAPSILRICQKWQIGNLLPPDWQFDKKKGLHRIPGRDVGLPTGIAAELNWDLEFMGDLIEMGFTGSGNSARRYGNVVLAEFDLAWPMKDLLDYAKKVLAYAKENYNNELKKRGSRVPSGRRRLQEYDTHLRIWDLKQQSKGLDGNCRDDFPRLLKRVCIAASSRPSQSRRKAHLRSLQRNKLN